MSSSLWRQKAVAQFFSPSQCKRGILCSELVLCCPLVWLFLGVMSRAGRRGKQLKVIHTNIQLHISLITTQKLNAKLMKKSLRKVPRLPFQSWTISWNAEICVGSGLGMHCKKLQVGWAWKMWKWDRALAIHLAVCIWRADAGRDDKTRWGFFLTFSPLFCLQRVNQTWTWNHIKLSSYCIGSLTGHVLKGLWVFGFVDFIWLPRTRWKLYSSACSDL